MIREARDTRARRLTAQPLPESPPVGGRGTDKRTPNVEGVSGPHFAVQLRPSVDIGRRGGCAFHAQTRIRGENAVRRDMEDAAAVSAGNLGEPVRKFAVDLMGKLHGGIVPLVDLP